MKHTRKHIVDHIKRLEGQLRAVRVELETEAPDCIRASETLLFGSVVCGLREIFVETFIREKVLRGSKPADEITFTSLLALIKG